jgi:hypothetical protein
MSKIERFYEDGNLTFNVNFKPIQGSPIICVENGLWYKFQIDEIEELDDNTFNIITSNLIAIDDKIIK